MGEQEGESLYAWVSRLMDVGLLPWALEKTEIWVGPTVEEALSRQYGRRIHVCHHITRAFHQLLNWNRQVSQ